MRLKSNDQKKHKNLSSFIFLIYKNTRTIDDKAPTHVFIEYYL